MMGDIPPFPYLPSWRVQEQLTLYTWLLLCFKAILESSSELKVLATAGT
jgi:hypothetical protein